MAASYPNLLKSIWATSHQRALLITDRSGVIKSAQGNGQVCGTTTPAGVVDSGDGVRGAIGAGAMPVTGGGAGAGAVTGAGTGTGAGTDPAGVHYATDGLREVTSKR